MVCFYLCHNHLTFLFPCNLYFFDYFILCFFSMLFRLLNIFFCYFVLIFLFLSSLLISLSFHTLHLSLLLSLFISSFSFSFCLCSPFYQLSSLPLFPSPLPSIPSFLPLFRSFFLLSLFLLLLHFLFLIFLRSILPCSAPSFVAFLPLPLSLSFSIVCNCTLSIFSPISLLFLPLFLHCLLPLPPFSVLSPSPILKTSFSRFKCQATFAV